MTLFDGIVTIIVGFFFLSSLARGMVRETFSLFGYLAGYILAINYHGALALVIQSMIMEEFMARISEFPIALILIKILTAIIIFFAVKVFFGLLGKLISGFIGGTKFISLPVTFAISLKNIEMD